MINPPNLRRQALEWLRQYGAWLASKNATLEPWCSAWLDILADQKFKSFILPEDGKIIEHDAPTKISFEGLRLPFEKCLLEYRVSPPDDPKPEDKDYAVDTAMILALSQDEDLISVAALLCGKEPDGRDMWLPFTTGARFDSSGWIAAQEGKTEVFSIPFGLVGSDDPDHEMLKHNLMRDMRRAAEFVLLCNCGNVAPQKVYTPKESMQRKALRNHRAPFNEYYALDISIPGEDRLSGHSQGEPTGRHVRLHTRRGHIRKLPLGYSKPFTWVRAATVGNVAHGQVANAYRVRPRPNLQPSQLVVPPVD